MDESLRLFYCLDIPQLDALTLYHNPNMNPRLHNFTLQLPKVTQMFGLINDAGCFEFCRNTIWPERVCTVKSWSWFPRCKKMLLSFKTTSASIRGERKELMGKVSDLTHKIARALYTSSPSEPLGCLYIIRFDCWNPYEGKEYKEGEWGIVAGSFYARRMDNL